MGLRAEAQRGCLLTVREDESGLLVAEMQRGFLCGEVAGDVAEKGLPSWELSEGMLISCSMSSTAAISCQLPARICLLLHTLHFHGVLTCASP